jgi:ANTAR domain
LSVYATEWCPWSGIDVAAVGAYAGVVAEAVRAGMALDARGALVATEGLDPAAASERLRARAGASQRTVADVAREVVQDAQRDRTAVIATERARSRAAEARAAHAEAALEAAQAEASQKDAGADGPPASPRGQHHSF